jgi:hypothetical protein
MNVKRLAAAVAAVMLALGAAAGAAHADTVTYDLTLTATTDTDGTPLTTYDGTGTITLSSAPSVSGQTDYGTYQAAVTFTIDGQSFSGFATQVQFQDGNFRNATFSEQIGSSPVRFALSTTGEYIFYYGNLLEDAVGSITATPAPTPLPAALPFFAAGLGALGLLGWRKKRTARSVAV